MIKEFMKEFKLSSNSHAKIRDKIQKVAGKDYSAKQIRQR
jgi:hypothetical protein